MENFIVGLGVGFILEALIIFAFFRCRFGWHTWGRWSLTGTGNGQCHYCEKCGVMGWRLFPGFTVTVTPPKEVHRLMPSDTHTPEEAARETTPRQRAETLLSQLTLYCGPHEVNVIAEAIAEAERRGAARLLGQDSTLTVNVLREWTPQRIESFALHLLGDAYLNLFNAAKEWREAHAAMTEKDRALGVAELLRERVTLEDVQALAELKSAEFGKRSALRTAADALIRDSTGAPEAQSVDSIEPSQATHAATGHVDA